MIAPVVIRVKVNHTIISITMLIKYSEKPSPSMWSISLPTFSLGYSGLFVFHLQTLFNLQAQSLNSTWKIVCNFILSTL